MRRFNLTYLSYGLGLVFVLAFILNYYTRYKDVKNARSEETSVTWKVSFSQDGLAALSTTSYKLHGEYVSEEKFTQWRTAHNWVGPTVKMRGMITIEAR